MVKEGELNDALREIASRPLVSAVGPIQPTEDQVAELIKVLAAQAAVPDLNEDGDFTWNEMQTAFERGVRASAVPAVTDNDVRVLRPLEAAILAWRNADADKDGRLNQDEARSVAGTKADTAAKSAGPPEAAEDRIRRYLGGCLVPPPPADATIVVLEFEKAIGRPSSTIVGQRLRTGLGDIIIEPGDKPIYMIVRATSPSILRLHGAVERVTHIVNLRAATGYVGGDAQLSYWSQSSECFSILQDKSTSKKFVERFEGALGQSLDQIVAVRDLLNVTFPNGWHDRSNPLIGERLFELTEDEVEKLSDRQAGHRQIIQTLVRDSTYVSIDPSTVRGPSAAQAYDFLPGAAGLLQMVQAGKLSIVAPDEIGITKGASRRFLNMLNVTDVVFQINEQVTLPTDNSRRLYILPEGVAPPKNVIHHFMLER